MKIAISGMSGCGNSSVSRLVAESLGLRLINFTFKDLAAEEGVSFEEICRRAETDTGIDLSLDKRQVELAGEGDCVLGSRLAIWLLQDADLKVFLTAGEEERARRISQREGTGFEETMVKTATRDKRDRARYLKLYGIDNQDYRFADLVIDTEEGDQYWVAEQIIKAAGNRIS